MAKYNPEGPPITAGSNVPDPTNENEFVAADAALTWVGRTLAQVRTILGLGSAAYTALTDYATALHLHTGVYDPAGSAAARQADMGITGKTDSTATTSSTVVASATAVKAAYDLANGKLAPTDAIPSPGPIGEIAPDTIRSLNKEVYKTANADSPLTSPQCSGTVVSNYGMTDADCSITLPAAAEGLAFLCILPTVRARYFRLQSAGTDKIYLSGVAGTGPGYVGVATGYATGAACSIFAFKASDGGFDWFCTPIAGAWIAG